MATFTKRTTSGIHWKAIIRTREVLCLSKTFKTEQAVQTWMRRMKADIDLAKATPFQRRMTLWPSCHGGQTPAWDGLDPVAGKARNTAVNNKSCRWRGGGVAGR